MKFTDNELYYLSHILRHFTDYMGGDDRPDHGFGILKEYRYLSDEKKRELYHLAGKIGRAERRRNEAKHNRKI